MDNNHINIKDFLNRYKWFLIPAGFVFFGLILFLVLQPTPQKNTPSLKPASSSPTPLSQRLPSPTQKPAKDTEVHGEIILYDDHPDLLKKDVLADGTTRYTMSSHNPSRPNIIIVTQNEEGEVFERAVLLSEYLKFFGPPEQIQKGSGFYGPDTQLYLYPSEGRSYIANPKTDIVLELHVFAPMSVEDYLKRFDEYL
jgi:hypothetical protein